MKTIDEHRMLAPADLCFHVAADVERWPEILPHYRWVRFHERRGFGRGRVEMAAWRPFGGPLRYPTWWASEMDADPDVPIVRYRHIGGITRGMAVRWEFHSDGDDTLVRIIHEWDGPRWPLIGRFAARHVIGPHFVKAIAGRTLAGVAAEAERRAEATPDAAARAPSKAGAPDRTADRVGPASSAGREDAARGSDGGPAGGAQ